jgi:biliverdin reductase
MPMSVIRLGIVGSGGMSTRRAKNFAKLLGVQVCTIAARNPLTGPALADQVGATWVTDWQTLAGSDAIDAVFIGTHNALHGPIAITALEAGKHVFSEYPTSRRSAENARLTQLIDDEDGPVLRLSNNESISAEHTALRQQAGQLGPLFTSHFLRLTPGRGNRPEVLFNLELTGPPALFFVYQVHGYVSMFGQAEWVHSTANYEGLREDTGYDRFSNTLTVGFASGGTGQWTWCGGIEIESAVQEARIVMRDGTLIETDSGWDVSTSKGVEPLVFGENQRTLEELFVADIKGETEWRADAGVGLQAAAIGHAAEISASEGRVVRIDELGQADQTADQTSPA